MRKKGFTLIELIAVLVILAILALIVTPLVMNIIKKARISADKRSIDAYGRSVELAVASYLLDKGDFPTSINDLKIEYKGDQVVCETAQIKNDLSIYLANCKVNNRSVDYVYGKNDNIDDKNFSIGNEVVYNNEEYHVIKNSGKNDKTVKLLKEEPLSIEQVNNLVNESNVDCQVVESNGVGLVNFGTNNVYENSNIKEILDEWKETSGDSENIVEVRLMTKNELINDFGYESQNINPSTTAYMKNDSTPKFIYNSQAYWSKDSVDDSTDKVYGISNVITEQNINDKLAIRPVVEVKKSSDVKKKTTYKIGDEITYNGINFYVIKDSDETTEILTVLKKEPLTVVEVNQYGGVGTANNRVNRYIRIDTPQRVSEEALNSNGYGGMAYYSSETCRSDITTGCTNDYNQSDIKYVLDAWSSSNLNASDLVADSTGYSVRLITFDELTEYLGFEYQSFSTTREYSITDSTPDFVYNNKYWYWTMSQYNDQSIRMRVVRNNGLLYGAGVYDYFSDGYDLRLSGVVRPVITLKKSALN